VRELPTGTVTFLFTDIARSTQLLRELREEYRQVLADQRRLVRAAFADHGGREVDNQGDAFFFAFPRAKDAVRGAIAAQRSLLDQEWPDGKEVLLRMALHTGEPELAEEGYFGLGVNRAARICAAGHGGQVLLSRSTAGVFEEDETPGVALLDLGQHRLKDLERPERIYQLVADGLLEDFPPLNTLEHAEKERELDEAARASELPSGTLTFLCTDMAGFTALVRELSPTDAGRLLDDHDRVLRDAVETAGGRFLDTAGDTVLACFRSAKDAVTAAAAAQLQVAELEWPRGVTVSIAIGLHTGEAVPVSRRYVGVAVNRVFSTCQAAHGGQVLLSESTASLLDEDDLREIRARDLGEYALKGFDRPVKLFQLEIPSLPTDFPAPKTETTAVF
jgi:class 3 adenylate cyclase